MKKKNQEQTEKYLRCPKCMTVQGPYPRTKEVVFCPQCHSLMIQEVSQEQSKKKALLD